MSKRINPAKRALWRDPNTMQLGVGPSALILENLTDAEERLISQLYKGMADDAVPPSETALLNRLAPVLLASESIEQPRLSGHFLRGAFAEIIRASYLTDRDGLAVLEQRAKLSVQLDSLGAGGLLIALGLAAAGVGRLVITDTTLVTEHDLGPLTFPLSARGATKINALVELLSERPSGTVVVEPSSLTPAKRRVALKVLVGEHLLHPGTYRDLKTEPHLGVIFGSDSVHTTPILRGSPCLACLERWRTEADPAWPALASQLIDSVDYLQDATSALAAASSAIGVILAELDGRNIENLGVRFDVTTRTSVPWSWRSHPNCECR